MRRYPRKIRKIIRYTRFKRSKYFRSTKRSRFALGARRFIRKPNKPELKWITLNYGQTINENNVYNNAISILQIPKGTGVSNRIGNQVRLIKNDVTLYVRDNSFQSGAGVVPTFQSYLTRVVFWTPRLDYTVASTYMVNNIDLVKPIDINYVNVIRDFTFQLSPAYLQEATSGDISGAPFAFSKVFKFKLLFPRKARFNQTDDLLDTDKDVMYMFMAVENTPGTATAGIGMQIWAKTWYYDN